MVIEEAKLNEISGGFGLGIIAGIGALITLIAGIFDGYMRPLKCN